MTCRNFAGLVCFLETKDRLIDIGEGANCSFLSWQWCLSCVLCVLAGLDPKVWYIFCSGTALPQCQFSWQWKSQPPLGSSSFVQQCVSVQSLILNLKKVMNLQLHVLKFVKFGMQCHAQSVPTAVVFCQSYSQIFKAMTRQLFQFDTFRRPVRVFIKPAVVNKWKTSLGVKLQQLSE